jgi:multidrug efflux pump
MLSDLAIKRPVFAGVMSALLIVLGVAALLRTPVREFPDVEAPFVSVSTLYRGAAPAIMDTEVTELIESAVSGVDGIKLISSGSRDGNAGTFIEFEETRDIDGAASDVRDAVSRVIDRLPEDAEAPQIIKADSDADPILRASLMSELKTPEELTDIAERTIVDRLSTIDGVAEVQIDGNRRYSIRLWLDQEALAARNLTVVDVENAVRRNSIELPAGTLKSTERQFSVRTESRIADVQTFRGLAVAQTKEGVVRLSDVARVEIGPADDTAIIRVNTKPAIGIGVLKQSKANTIAVAQAVRAQLEEIRSTLPEGVELQIAVDDSVFIQSAINEVVYTLFEAMLLVVAVIALFLGSWRATAIPAITIPVALIGTFIFIALAGFSINVLTLLALLLAIGLVVDDAIVVVENIQRRIDLGEPPLLASYLGTRQVFFAVMATSITLIAVFVPISLLEGQIGRLFREFGFVLAAAVAISTFVALTLTPMMCSKMLSPHKGVPGPMARVSESIDRLGRRYAAMLDRSLNRKPWVLGAALVFALVSGVLWNVLPSELTPVEDRGAFNINVNAPKGSTLEYTSDQVARIEDLVMPLVEKGEAYRVFARIGQQNNPTSAFFGVRLVDWADRDRSQQEMVAELAPKLAQLPGVQAFAFNRPTFGGRGGSQLAFRAIVNAPTYAQGAQWAEEMQARMREVPGFTRITDDYEPDQPQLNIRIDRQRAADLQISVDDISRTLQTLLAARRVSTYIDRGREYDVLLEAPRGSLRNPSDLQGIFVRSASSGELYPISGLIELDATSGPAELRRFNRQPAIAISATLAENFSMGDAVNAVRAIAEDVIPPEGRLEFSGETRQFLEASGSIYLTFALALLVVYLVLAAQFESLIHPIGIMVTVPLAVTGALLALFLTGNSLNIYSQIGVILLVGIMAKNGILIVEFANQLRGQGRSIREAVVEASAVRFRPIIMTTLATILGAVPLIIATGAGSESRAAIGVVVVGGLTIAGFLTLFVTPAVYTLTARFTKPSNAVALEVDRLLARNDRPEAQAAE